MKGAGRIEALAAHGVLADIDRFFAALIADLGADDDIALLAATVSAMHRSGHICVELRRGGQRIADLIEQPGRESVARLPAELAETRLPSRTALIEALADSPVVADVESLDFRPLVLDRDRVYFHRLFVAERDLAERLLALAGRRDSGSCAEQAAERVFAETEDRTEEAETAIRAALERRLCIVTGGPGTGKTTLAAKLIGALVASRAAAPGRVGLAAPTGKASSRLQESVRGKLAEAPLNQVPGLDDFPAEARTIHRLLADRSRPLGRLHALVVDECSMADLPLMVRLVTALPEDCRLILLGDANQLSSVEPGSVFSDLCRAGERGPLSACVTTLRKNYRFRTDSGIGRLASAVVAGNVDGAIDLLEDAHDGEIGLLGMENEAAFDDLARECATEWSEHMAALETDPERASPFPSRRVLCSHRQGPFGTNRFNRLVERRLTELGRRTEYDEFYVGRPIIVSRNDRQTGLSNGDTGVVLPADSGRAQVWFPDLDRDGERFLVSPSRLPQHESFFALTVHRAQGSEYQEVIFMPGDATSPVNAREMFYTAVTRGRRSVRVMASRAAVRAALLRTTSRATGLLDRLR